MHFDGDGVQRDGGMGVRHDDPCSKAHHDEGTYASKRITLVAAWPYWGTVADHELHSKGKETKSVHQ